MTRQILITLAVSFLVGLSGCDLATVDTTKNTVLSPEDMLARLMQLARAGDGETYVHEFYGESYKFEGIPERRDAVVARFRVSIADRVVAGFVPLESKVAEIVEGGTQAVFKVDVQPAFVLYLSADGRWKFHL